MTTPDDNTTPMGPASSCDIKNITKAEYDNSKTVSYNPETRNTKLSTGLELRVKCA
jgi:hypothetical protein